MKNPTSSITSEAADSGCNLPPTVSVYGPPGTGKTLTTRRICRAFAAYHDDVAVEYVNLKECRTLFSAANEILFALTGDKRDAYEGLVGSLPPFGRPSRPDAPASRSLTEKSTQLGKERDKYVCQRCGDHNGNYEQSPPSLETPSYRSRKVSTKVRCPLGLNLVTVCEPCHGFLEGAHVEWQLAEIGRDDALRILTVLKEWRLTSHLFSRKLDISENCVRSLVSLLEWMSCLTTQGDGWYQTVCPATSKSRVGKAPY